MQTVLVRLAVRGFAAQFKATGKGLLSMTTQRRFQPRDITVEGVFRFEGESDPNDTAILYAIKTMNGEMGTLADAYGLYHDAMVTDFMQQVRIDSNLPMLD